MILEWIQLIIYALLIVIIAKYFLVKILRRLAQVIELSPKTVGNIAGIATSVPEFLTVSFSAFSGLMSASIYNIISSNVINFVQYIISLFVSKNQSKLKNKAIATCLILAIGTIIIPIIMLNLNIEFSIKIVPIFILMFIIFYYINIIMHKKFLKDDDEKLSEENSKESDVKNKTSILIKYSIYLLITSIILYIVGNALSGVLENLASVYKISESILGILLGFITSIPELMTFFEAQKHHKEEDTKELGVVEATNNLFISNSLNLFIIQSIGIVINSIF